MDSFEDFERLRQLCVEDGLLKPTFGAGNLRITKRGQNFVKVAASADPEVAEAVQDVLRSPFLERREALVSVVRLLAVLVFVPRVGETRADPAISWRSE